MSAGDPVPKKQRKQREPHQPRIIVVGEPDPERLLDATLLLLGWTHEEIAEDRTEREAERRAQAEEERR